MSSFALHQDHLHTTEIICTKLHNSSSNFFTTPLLDKKKTFVPSNSQHLLSKIQLDFKADFYSFSVFNFFKYFSAASLLCHNPPTSISLARLSFSNAKFISFLLLSSILFTSLSVLVT